MTMIVQYLIIKFKEDLIKSEILKVPSFVKKKIPEMKNIAEIIINNLLLESSIKRTRKDAPSIINIDGRMMIEILEIS